MTLKVFSCFILFLPLFFAGCKPMNVTAIHAQATRNSSEPIYQKTHIRRKHIGSP